jgi:hypothetical protein
MSVFTIFCHGTGGESNKGVKKAEIVNLFSSSVGGFNGSHYRLSNTKADSFTDIKKTQVAHYPDFALAQADYITLEGVGSGGDPASKSFDADTGKWTLGGKAWAITSLVRKATGYGTDISVNNAVNYVIYKMRNNQTPSVINIMGWSRGAVQAIRIAYRLYQDSATNHIPINIFGIDPVAGLGSNHDIDAKTINGNVKTFVSVISIGEDRWAFTPMHEETFLQIDDSVKYIPLHMPGVHDTIAKYDNSAGKLAFHLCYRFLKNRGTKMGVTDAFEMQDIRCLQHYGLLLAGRGGTFGMNAGRAKLFGRFEYGNRRTSKPEKSVPSGQGRIKAYTTGGGFQARTVEFNDFVSNKSVFFNAHHEALFEAQCPQTYKYYFGNMRDETVSPIRHQHAIWLEMDSLKAKIGVAAAEAHHSALLEQDIVYNRCRNLPLRKDYMRHLSLADLIL